MMHPLKTSDAVRQLEDVRKLLKVHINHTLVIPTASVIGITS